MTFEAAQSEFAIRYYHWAQAEARAEVAQGFRLLANLNTRPSRTLLHLMAKLPLDERQGFAKALVKRFHPQAAQLVGEALSGTEASLVQCYVDSILTIPENEKLNVGDGIRRRKLASMVKHCMASVLNQVPEDRGSGNWRYTNKVASFQLYTHLDIGGRFHTLCYSQDIVFSGHFLLVEGASIHSWLGLSSQTLWSYLDEPEAGRIALLVSELCGRFLKAAPALVDGLSPSELTGE